MPYIVKSPVEGYNGTSAGVKFKDGVGKTDNPHAADWLKSHGYEVTEEQPAKPDKAPAAPPPADEPPTDTPLADTPQAPEAPKQPEAKAPAAANKGGGKGSKKGGGK